MMHKAWVLAALAGVAMPAAIAGRKAQAQKQLASLGHRAGAQSKRPQLMASSPKPVVALGKPFLLALELRNRGTKTLAFQEDANPDVNFLLIAKRKDGLKVPLTKYGSYVSHGGFTGSAGGVGERMSHSEFVTLKRGQHKQYVLPVSKIYDMTRKGVYEVTAVLQLVPTQVLQPSDLGTSVLTAENRPLPKPNEPGTIRLVSNTVTVTVK